MSDLNLAAELKDIHLPEPIGIFPLAPGWWLLIIIFCLLVFLTLFVRYRRYYSDAHRRKALNLLNTYEKDYAINKNSIKTCALISELLKRVALLYFPRNQVAFLSGDSWIEFLNQTGKGIDFIPFKYYLTELIYQRNPIVDSGYLHHEEQLANLFSTTRKWIGQRSGTHV